MNRRATFPAASALPCAPTRLTDRPVEAGPTYSFRTVDCDECEGAGCFHSAVHVATEYLDADLSEFPCEACEGSGEVDAACADCLVVRPLDDEGFCQPCAEASILSADEWNARYAQVADGEAAIARIAEVYRTHRVVVRGRG